MKLNSIGFLIIFIFLLLFSKVNLFAQLIQSSFLNFPNIFFEFYVSAIKEQPYLGMINIILIVGLNILLLFQIIKNYKNISLPFSLNLVHIVKNLKKDIGSITYLDRYKSSSQNTIRFYNKISIDKTRYENNINQIREYLRIDEDSEIEINQISSKIIELKIKKIPTFVELYFHKIINNKIYIGKTFNNEDFYLDFNQLTHTLIVGESGSGKSTLLNLIILSLLKNINIIDKLFLIDFKQGVELYKYSKIEKVKFIDQMEQLVLMLENITNIMNERLDTLKESGELKYQGNHLFVIIDEVGTIGTYYDKKIKDKIFSLLINLLQKSRAANIHFFFFAQKIEISVLPSQITSNIQSKVLMKTDNDYNQNQTIGTKEIISKSTNLEPCDFPRGRGIFKDGISSDKTLFQVPYYNKDLWKNFIFN